MGVTYKYISNYVGICDNNLNQSRLYMLQSKLRRRSINLDTLFVVILDALIQIYSLPLYIQRRTRFMVLKTTVRQVYILITRHTIHELISTLFNHLLNIIRMKTRRHRIPNIMVSIGILLLFLCRFPEGIKHKLHVTKSLNFTSQKLRSRFGVSATYIYK